MSEKPKHGDKVRVSYEGTWHQPPLNTTGLVELEDGSFAGLPRGATVEILEHADDPANDPIGTLRREDVETHDYNGWALWAKIEYLWRVVDSSLSKSQLTCITAFNDDVRSFPIVGVIPFTAAAMKEEVE